MAVISELIDAGLRLRESGNLRGAIEHFRQLDSTYPKHARIMFELAGTWRAFGVPEQALPLYRELLALPKAQGLAARYRPRLYTQLAITLGELGDLAEALAIIEEGLCLHPGYRPLRAWRILTLQGSGAPQLALLDALELMLESLAPSRWDIFEADIIAAVKALRASLQDAPAPLAANASETSRPAPPAEAEEPAAVLDIAPPEKDPVTIEVAPKSAAEADFEVAVSVLQPAKKQKKPRQSARPQLGRRAVRIDIHSDADEKKSEEDDEPPASAANFKIPIDID